MNRISDSMFHSRSTACKKPYGAVPAGQAVEFSVYPQRAQGALQVTLWIEEDGCQAESHPLHWCGYQGSHDRYTVTYTPPHPGLYWYYFSVELADGLHYCARGYGGQAELLEAVGDKYQLTVYDGEYHTPRWFGEGITYNIFPDRFCRDKAPEQPESEGVVERVLHQNWDDIPVYLPDEHGEILNNDFFGGTLRGVYAKRIIWRACTLPPFISIRSFRRIPITATIPAITSASTRCSAVRRTSVRCAAKPPDAACALYWTACSITPATTAAISTHAAIMTA